MKLITVPHSGTTWMRELLESWGLGFETHHADVDPPSRHPWPSTGEKVVVTARDPVLVEVSAQNRGRWVDFKLWVGLEGWMELENVHFFRVDCPIDEREDEIRRLAEFCGVDVPDSVDWTPKNTSNDRLGLKERYAAGEWPPELDRIRRFLGDSAPVQRLFRELGYEGLPWMAP